MDDPIFLQEHKHFPAVILGSLVSTDATFSGIKETLTLVVLQFSYEAELLAALANPFC